MLEHALTVATAAQIHKLEDEINTIVTILQYAAPLLGGVILLYLGLYTRVAKAIRKNTRTLDTIVQQTNGPITDIKAQVGEIRDATVPSTTNTGGEPATESAATK